MAESVLQPYRTEIVRLYFEERNSQAEIIRYLEQAHGFRVTPSTLSRFIKALPEIKKPLEPGEPNVSPDEEKVLQDGRTWVLLQTTLEEIMSQHAATQARLSVIEDEAAARHATLLKQLDTPASAAVSHQDMIAVWKKAALCTGVGWLGLALFVAFVWLR
jgi:arginine repressor